MALKVLITDMRHKSAVEEKRVLEEAGIQLEIGMCETEEELIEKGRDCAGFLVSYAPVTRTVLEALPELKVIVKYGIGVDNIDVAAATELGKIVAIVPEPEIEEVATHALALLLSGFRMTDFFARMTRRFVWSVHPEEYTVYRLSESKLGLLGFGRIGRKLAELAAPLFNSILVYDPYVDDTIIGQYPKCLPVHNVEALFSQCQGISIHVPLTDTTRGMVNDEVLNLASGLILVVTSRAGVVEMEAVLRGLDTGRILFFGADVFWTEPPDFNDPTVQAIISHERVMITPHVAWYSTTGESELRRQAAEEIKTVLLGGKPRYPVNPEVFARDLTSKEGGTER